MISLMKDLLLPAFLLLSVTAAASTVASTEANVVPGAYIVEFADGLANNV